MKKREILNIIIGLILFVSLITLYVVEYRYLSNTIFVSHLILYAILLFGIGTSYIPYYFIKERIEFFEKFMIGVGWIVLVMILSPPLASLTNRILTNSETEMRSYELIDISARSEQPMGILDVNEIDTSGYRLEFLINDSEKNIYLKMKPDVNLEEKKVSLPIRRGFWGYEYVNSK